MTDFETFAHARAPQLLRSAWLLCGDAHQAEDLVQETLAKVYVRWHRRQSSPVLTPDVPLSLDQLREVAYSDVWFE